MAVSQPHSPIQTVFNPAAISQTPLSQRPGSGQVVSCKIEALFTFALGGVSKLCIISLEGVGDVFAVGETDIGGWVRVVKLVAFAENGVFNIEKRENRAFTDFGKFVPDKGENTRTFCISHRLQSELDLGTFEHACPRLPQVPPLAQALFRLRRDALDRVCNRLALDGASAHIWIKKVSFLALAYIRPILHATRAGVIGGVPVFQRIHA